MMVTDQAEVTTIDETHESTDSLSDDDSPDLEEDVDLSYGVHWASTSSSMIATPSPHTALSPPKDPCIGLPVFPDLNVHDPNSLFSGISDEILDVPAPTFSYDDAAMDLDCPRVAEPVLANMQGPLTALAAATPVVFDKATDPNCIRSGEESSHRNTLILEDVHPDTVNNIMNVLFKSREKVKMRLFSQEERDGG